MKYRLLQLVTHHNSRLNTKIYDREDKIIIIEPSEPCYLELEAHPDDEDFTRVLAPENFNQLIISSKCYGSQGIVRIPIT